MRKRFVIVGIIIVIAVLAWLLFLRPKNGDQKQGVVERGTVVEELVISGGIEAKEHAVLNFPVNGELLETFVAVGDRVEKGQVLSRLDSTGLWASAQQADAAYRSAQATLNKVYDQLQGNETDESFTQIETRSAAETAKDQAYFALVAAQENLSKGTLRAPFSGIVSYVGSSIPGVTILASQPQIEIVNPETVYFTVYADQNEVNSIQVGNNVKVILDSYPEETLEGSVASVSVTPSSTEVGVVYPIEIMLNTSSVEGEIIRIGMTGDAIFSTAMAENVYYVSPQFIKRDPQGTYLLSENNNKIYIETGIEGEDRVEVKGDFPEGLIVYD